MTDNHERDEGLFAGLALIGCVFVAADPVGEELPIRCSTCGTREITATMADRLTMLYAHPRLTVLDRVQRTIRFNSDGESHEETAGVLRLLTEAEGLR
jgi:hypothetical protein